MHKIQHYFSYKYKSIMFQIILAFILFTFFTFIIIIAFFIKPVSKTIQEKNNLMYNNVLNSSKNIVDLSLTSLHDIITNKTSESSIIKAVVLPNSLDSSNDLEVQIGLSTLSGENKLISDVYLYIPKNNKVFTSRYEIIKRDAFYGKDLLDSYYKDPGKGNSIENNGRITRIFQYDSNLYLIRDFPLDGAKRLGTLFLKLDTNKLYNTLQGEGVDYSNNLLVYDSMNQPVFPNNIDYSAASNIAQKKLSEKGNSVELIQNKRYFYIKSLVTQFQFLFVIDDRALMPSAKETFLIVLPMATCSLIGCLFLAFFLTKKLYLPIIQLVSIVKNQNSANPGTPFKNEFDYLNGSFHTILDNNTNLNQVIQNIIPDISTKIFNDLLTGKPMETVYIENVLKSIASTLDTSGIYNVMVIKIDPDAATDASDLFLISIIRIIKAKSIHICRYHIQMTGKSLISIIFEFEKSIPELNIKLFEMAIDKTILTRSKNLHLDVLLEKGNVYHSIQEIQFSFEEAFNQLIAREQRLENNEPVVVSTNTEEHAQPYYSSEYFASRIDKIYDLVISNNTAGALILAKQISKSIVESDYSFEEIRQFYSIYIDTILNKMVSFHINIKENSFHHILQNEGLLDNTKDLSEMQNYVDNFCEQALTLVTEYYNKQNHKYIIEAKKYIEAHYSDPNISLGSVAEHVDTNISYLSKLFSSNLNINFNDYINSYRIEQAKILFDTSDISVKTAAITTGFNSQQNFIRVFKKFEGTTPGQYKK